jgi:FKBP-type peptidyl-prolyl cis-trans isomerase
LAACGSSGSGGIELAPSQGATQVSAPTTPKPPPALRTKPTVTVSPSSCNTKQLVKKDLVTGTGKTAAPGQTVTVNYVGVLCKTGKEFDSSWSRNQPSSFPLTAGGVIQGWVEGIPGMKVGSRRELIIPANLAYGKAGRPPTIPPNSTLVFVVDLLSVS